MRLAVLGARSREGPDTANKVDLRPGHARYLLTALTCQSEHLDDCAVTPAHCPRREETLASSSSVRTRSRVFSIVGALTPSQGERSRIARPTHQLKKALVTLSVLFAATGAPRSTTAVMRSMMSRLEIS